MSRIRTHVLKGNRQSAAAVCDEEIELAQKMEAGSVAVEKIPLLKERLAETGDEQEKEEIQAEIKALQLDVDRGSDAKNVWRRQIFVW